MVKRLIAPLLLGAWAMASLPVPVGSAERIGFGEEIAPVDPPPQTDEEKRIAELEEQKRARLLLLAELCEQSGAPARGVLYLVEALEVDPADEGTARKLTAMAGALAASGTDTYRDMLAPLLDHPDVSVAVLVVGGLGSGRDNRHFPLLLLDALESDRPEVVEEAMRWSPNCWDKGRKPEVHARLRTIFEGRDDYLKLRACFPLMHDFKDKEAIAYLLKETRSENRGRALLAVGWIGDTCNSRAPVYPELLEALEPQLTSDDDRMRRAAVCAIGTYQGEAAIRHLIAALADANGAVVYDARIGLVHTQRDVDTVVRLVNEALEQETRADVEHRLREVLDGIEKKKKQMTESR